jgi:hypothetical protein
MGSNLPARTGRLESYPGTGKSQRIMVGSAKSYLLERRVTVREGWQLFAELLLNFKLQEGVSPQLRSF